MAATTKYGRITAVLLAALASSGARAAEPPPPSAAGGQIVPFYRNIVPFYRNIVPFYRNIVPFWGGINPFYRNIVPFWGEVNPFYGNVASFWGDFDPMVRNTASPEGKVVPEYRTIAPFWESTGALWSEVDKLWQGAGSYSADTATYGEVRDRLREIAARSDAMWGRAVVSQTGGSFGEAFAAPFFARYGIDLEDPATLAALPVNDRSILFLDWYDGLMHFAGTDHVDWWMKTANWTPALAQVQQAGASATIGLIDTFIAADADLHVKTTLIAGASNAANAHGAGVASLMVADHDGRGVMGVAPNARLAVYDPFDATGTADWPDVRRGIAAVTQAGASVVNLSLGVSGSTFHPDWQGVFASDAVAAAKGRAIYVIAAGNDGSSQTQNIEWSGAAADTTFLVVGSIDPGNTISVFSNRPGEACLVRAGVCTSDADKLKHRFVVAPGELILVSDGAGGAVRASGTSIAAPLVSGTIALLHDRWPWLKNHPHETAKIILRSAKDLGEPGVDAVYGAGLLDIAASQAPLNFNNLTFYEVHGGKLTVRKAQDVRRGGVQASWETDNVYFTAFEKHSDTHRDFLIPLSSRLVGTREPGSGERFQDYVYSRMLAWMSGGSNSRGFSDLAPQTALVPNRFGWNLSMTAAAVNPGTLRSSGSGPRLQMALRLATASDRLGLSVGQGDGAIALGRQSAFGMFSDHAAQTGGVNPLLGFASGGSYAAADLMVTPTLSLAFGTTEQRGSRGADRIGADSVAARAALAGLDRYRATAGHATLNYRIIPFFTVTAAVTTLDEAAGLLGVRSAEPGDLRGGSRSNAITLGADVELHGGLSLAASATASRTRTAGRHAALATSASGLFGTAYQLTLSKNQLFATTDRARLSIAQPLMVERGSLELTEVRVVDRSTGELGVRTDRFDVASTGRRFVMETIYGLSLANGRAEISAFGRAELGAVPTSQARLMVGIGGRAAF